MQLVSPGAEVPPGEQVVTSGYQSGLYPRGSRSGSCPTSTRTRARSTKVIALRPAVDFSSLQFVQVVTGHEAGLRSHAGGLEPARRPARRGAPVAGLAALDAGSSRPRDEGPLA